VFACARFRGRTRLLGGVFGCTRLRGCTRRLDGRGLLSGVFGRAYLPGGDLRVGQNVSKFNVDLAKEQSKPIAFDPAAHSRGNRLAQLRKRHKLGV
jgi:hypothetical protein